MARVAPLPVAWWPQDFVNRVLVYTRDNMRLR
jgi:hypothetical protein